MHCDILADNINFGNNIQIFVIRWYGTRWLRYNNKNLRTLIKKKINKKNIR